MISEHRGKVISEQVCYILTIRVQPIVEKHNRRQGKMFIFLLINFQNTVYPPQWKDYLQLWFSGSCLVEIDKPFGSASERKLNI
ncbi:hypothetical protein HHI36_012712 [Cryptolaemus montrouzieri]|uniref:Uncharacterized protein n=1 Tax=Cryptolaemus montrouzieri TaxID=559131 RepID=A0ABD2NG74_9CUCU